MLMFTGQFRIVGLSLLTMLITDSFTQNMIVIPYSLGDYNVNCFGTDVPLFV